MSLVDKIGLIMVAGGLVVSGWSLYNIVNKSEFYSDYFTKIITSNSEGKKVSTELRDEFRKTNENVSNYILCGVLGVGALSTGIVFTRSKFDYQPSIRRRKRKNGSSFSTWKKGEAPEGDMRRTYLS